MSVSTKKKEENSPFVQIYVVSYNSEYLSDGLFTIFHGYYGEVLLN